MVERRRAAVNIILPKRVLQRGQIFTWTRDVKARFFQEHGITAVVNFWPKVDSDLGDLGLDWYWQISCPRSEQMLEERIMRAAACVSDYLTIPNTSVLVLCEAGKTRSVFFCILLVSVYKDISYAAAHTLVKKACPGIGLKGFMTDWLEKYDA